MGSFANSLFQLLLGWVRMLFSSLWETASSPGSGSLLRWLGDHWLSLLIGICAAGALCDLTVYIFRWRPYRVWASFFRRIRNRKQEAAEDPGETEVLPEEAYETEDASEVAYPVVSRFEEAGEEEPEAVPARAWTWDEPGINPADPAGMESSSGGIRTPAQDAITEVPDENGMTARFEQAIRPRRRRARVMDLFNEDAPQADYTAPQELIDRREAYHRPVYPRGWKGNNQSES